MWIIACLGMLAAVTPPASPAALPDTASSYIQPEALRRYGQARLLEEEGEAGRALGEYYRILAIDPRSTAVLVRASELAARTGDPGRSLELAERALAADPDHAEALWLRGSAYYGLGRGADALADLQRAFDLDSTRIEFARALARAAEEVDRVDLVARAYRRVTELAWDDQEAWFQLAAAEARLGHFTEAKAALTEAIDDGFERPGSMFLQGWISEGLGERDQAIEAYRDHLALHPDDRTTRSRLAHLLAAEERYNEALIEARQLSAASPDDLDALEDQADLALRAGQRGEANRALDRMNHLEPDNPEVLARRMDVLARNKKNADAEALAKEWARRHPGDPAAALQLARGAALAGSVDRAVTATQKAIAAAPDSLAPRILLARIYQNHKLWAEANTAWRDVADRFPDHVGVALDHAFCLQESGDTLAAERRVRELLARHPDQPQALNFLGYLLAEANRDLEEAEDLIRRALEREPENGAIVDSMGWVLYRLGHLTEARRELERAVRLTGGDATVLEHLGDVYRDLRLSDLAREQYRKALAAKGDGPRLKSKLERLP